ncbi:hypothetical protein [Xenorhabdus littoralis]|uniref:hypothetical protein n=1 Tax=Xenorhabdus littoralis TaxID=2582835 RepID=UPI0029E7E50C|nr:hypothetical protein [Xenorhabdus sp. psl]MDX7993161.1 hypothetical protein [Xenorhabdus sp. psl]
MEKILHSGILYLTFSPCLSSLECREIFIGEGIATWVTGNIKDLVAVLDEHAYAVTDGGGLVSGEPGLIGKVDDRAITVISTCVREGRICDIWVMRNPEKLTGWN